MSPEVMAALGPLEWLLSPVPSAEFLREYFEKRIFVRQRPAADDESLFTLAEFDEQLSLGVGSGRVRIVQNGRDVTNPSGHKTAEMSSLDDVYKKYRSGATISLTHVHKYVARLRGLCQGLAACFSANVQVNAYLTPPHSRGLGKHFDTHDVFVLQLSGSKKWRLGGRAVDHPAAHRRYSKNLAEAVAFERDLVLTVGDLLYIPRGIVHQAESTDSTSLHLTIGIVPITYGDLILAEIEDALETNPKFRAALPFGFARAAEARGEAERAIAALFELLGEQISAHNMIDNAVDILSAKGPRDEAGHLLDLEAARDIASTTSVKRRADVSVEKRSLGSGAVELRFHGKVITFPSHLKPAVEAIEKSERFTANDLPQRLDERSRLQVVKTLLEEGVLTLSD